MSVELTNQTNSSGWYAKHESMIMLLVLQGCYEKFNEFIDKYQYWAIGVSATLIIIEVCTK